MSLRDDRRGLAAGLMLFGAAIVITALLYLMLNPVVTDAEAMLVNQTGNQTAETAIEERATIWGYIPVFGLFAAGVFVIVRAVFESQVR